MLHYKDTYKICMISHITKYGFNERPPWFR